MKYKCIVFLVLVATLQCYGHHSILGNILSNARERIHSGVEGVAGAILGGFNLNFGLNGQYRPQEVPQRGSEETIVVVVDEPDNYDYGNTNDRGPILNGPPRPPYDHHHERPPINDESAPPPPPPHHHHRPPPHYDSNPPPPPPHHQSRPHGDPRPGYNDQNQGQDDNYNKYGNNQIPGNPNNQNSYPGNNEDNNGYQPIPKDTEKNYPNNPNNGPNVNPSYDKPSTEYIKTPDLAETSPSPKYNEINKTTEKSDDLPLFVPLSPDEYIYGGDKINISTPKRDTEKTSINHNEGEKSNPAHSGDDEFDIDIRLKGE